MADVLVTSTPVSRRAALAGLGAAGLAVALLGGGVAGRGAASAAGTDGHITCEIVGLGQFDVLSYSGFPANADPTRAGSVKVDAGSLALVKSIDAHSAELSRAVVTGTLYRKAILTVVDATGRVTLAAVMKQVLVSAISVGGSAGDVLPTENVTLDFVKARLTYGG